MLRMTMNNRTPATTKEIARTIREVHIIGSEASLNSFTSRTPTILKPVSLFVVKNALSSVPDTGSIYFM
ncbi:hypothetical protein D3C81_2082890 [compost metagenome]